MYFKFLIVALLVVAAAAHMPKSALPKAIKIRGGGDVSEDTSDAAQKVGTIWHLGYGLTALVAPDKLNDRLYESECASDDGKLTMRYAGLFCSMVGLMGNKLPKADAFKMYTLSCGSAFLLGLKGVQDEVFKDKVSVVLSGLMALAMGFFAKKESE